MANRAEWLPPPSQIDLQVSTYVYEYNTSYNGPVNAFYVRICHALPACLVFV